MAQVQLRDQDGNGIKLMNVRYSFKGQSADEAFFDVFTDYAGNSGWPIPGNSGDPSLYTFWINTHNVNEGYISGGYNPMDYIVDQSDDGNFNIRITIPRAQPVSHESGHLRVEGRNFVTDNGQPWQFRGYSCHYLQNCFVGGYDCSPFNDVLDQIIEYGYNTIIHIGFHNSPWKRAHGWAYGPHTDPNFFHNLYSMCQAAADKRMRLAPAILADIQYWPQGFYDPQWFFREYCEVIRDFWNVLPRKGNEDRHNGWRPQDYHFPDMKGLLLSHGSRGAEVNPFFPYLDWVEFEVKRKLPKMFLDLPLRQMMDGDFQGPATNRPTVNIEPMYFADTNPDHVGDKRSTDSRVALESGAAMYACAGGGFGCSLGLECKVLPAGSISDACAREFIRGLKAGFVRPFAGLDFQGQR